MILALLAAAVATASPVTATAAPAPVPAAPIAPTPVAAAAAFDQLKSLVGTWRNADRPDSPLRIHFYLTAGGTVLVESWEARGQPHSLTLYHRDGPALLATHYCPQGNQPRLALAGRDANGLHFAFKDATDLDPAKESHQHDLWFDLSKPARPVRSEVYSGKDGPGEQERIRLVRVSTSWGRRTALALVSRRPPHLCCLRVLTGGAVGAVAFGGQNGYHDNASLATEGDSTWPTKL
jgi:hypothetical protein